MLSISVGDLVWYDLNTNGIQDAGEPGVAGVVVEIFSSTNTTIGDADDISCGISITDANGNYSFSGLTNDLNYYQIFRTPVGYTFTAQNAGSDDAKDSDVNHTGITELFTISAGLTDVTRDAGLVGTAPSFGFALPIGAANDDIGKAVCTDSANNVYVTGCFSSTTDFDPGPGTYNLTPSGSQSIFVAKYTPAGALSWARSADASDTYGIAVGPDGSVYTTGYFNYSVDFDPGTNTYYLNAINGGIFVWKLDSEGDLVWANARDSGYIIYASNDGLGIDVAADGSVYTTGGFGGTVDFDPGDGTFNLTSSYGDAFVSKLDSTGNFSWAVQFGGTDGVWGKQIAVAPDGSVYTIGSFYGSADFDPGPATSLLTSAGSSDVFISKLDSAGNFVWAHSKGGANYDAGRSIAVSSDGNVYASGSNFVAKLDQCGNYIWTRTVPTGDDLAVAQDGSVYATGMFAGTVDFDPGPSTYNLSGAGFTDIFVSKLDSAGNFRWARRVGGSASDEGTAIAVASDGSVYTTGVFTGMVDFDPGTTTFNITSAGGYEGFLSKLVQLSVGDRIWNDLNSNGVQDAGEPGVAGAVVELYSSTDTTIGDADDVFQGRAITDANGNYTIGGLLPGVNYYEIFRAPAGFTFTTKDAGGDDTKDSDVNSTGVTSIFTISDGRSNMTRDAGLLGGAPAFGFASSAGAEKDDYGHDVTTDAAGNIYVTGDFQKTVDFDPGPGTYNLTAAGSIGYEDVFVAKYTPAGALLWARRMGGSGFDTGYGITVADDGSIYTTGDFTNTADFDPGPGIYNLTSAGSSDIFVSKLDAAGNFIWARNMGGTSSETGLNIAVAADGSVYTTGYFQHTADFDPGPGTVNFTAVGPAAFISKLDSSGNFVWARYADGMNQDFGQDIVVADDGSVYATGTFQYTVDFDPGAGTYNLTSKGGNDVFVWKLDSSGNLVWARSMGGAGMEEARGIALADDGSVYTTGAFQGTADFDPGTGTLNLTSSGSYDVFVSKLNSAGNVVWARSMGGNDGECGFDIALGVNGNIYTTGVFSGVADFDPGIATFNLININAGIIIGSWDIFISELNSAGDFVGAYSMGGSSGDGGSGITVSNDGSIYTTGYFASDMVDFDPGPGIFNLTSKESDEFSVDIFVLKLRINHAPTDIELSSDSIAENQPSGTAVGTFSTNDYNIGDTFAYTLVTGTGSADNASFAINGNTLLTTASFDYETKSSYSIRVRSTDQSGLYTEKTFTINVTDVNETPVLFVDADAAPSGDGLAWSTAFDDLQLALAQAAAYNGDTTPDNDVDQIWIAEGTYKPTAELEPGDVRSASFSLLDSVTLYGGFVGDETSLDDRDWITHITTLSGDLGVEANKSDNAYTVVYCGENIESTVDGLTVTAGNADGEYNAEHPERLIGGGIYSRSTLTVTYCTLSSNSALSGGGICNHDGIMTVTNCTLSGNSAGNRGGGIYNSSDDLTATITVSNSVFSGNSASSGGGICNHDGIMTVTDCTLSGNSSGCGGGIYNAGTLTVTGSTLSNNSPKGKGDNYGGAIFNYGTLTLANSTISGNSTGSGGGGICNDDPRRTTNCTMTISNCTISGNSIMDYTSHFGGGGILNAGALTVTNSTISGNLAGELGGGISSFSGSGTIALNNTIVAKNTARCGPDIGYVNGAIIGSHSLIGNGSGQWAIVDGVDGNIVGTSENPIDPLFVRAPSDGGDGWGDDPSTPDVDESANDDYGDLRLRYGSLAVDAGSDALAVDGDGHPLVTDIDGNTRIVGECVDIGAYESCVPTRLMADANLDAKVDDVDAAILSANWLKPPSAPGDANLDGHVNETDAAIMSANWMTTSGATWADGDFNRDGRVDAVDSSLMATNWQMDCTHLLLNWGDGDFNDDGYVDDIDAAILATNIGRSVFFFPGDANRDGWVDEVDAAILSANWLKPPSAPGDANLDGHVNEADAAIMSAHWMTTSDATWADGDFNRDGRVDAVDSAMMTTNWQMDCSHLLLGWSDGDFNGDGYVDDIDAALLATNMGQTLALSTAASAAATTEPNAETQPADSDVAPDDTNGAEANIKTVRYDLDNSGRVDLGDLAVFASVYREQPGVTTENPYAYAADYDGSGTIDLGDLALFAANYRTAEANSSLVLEDEAAEASLATAQTALAAVDSQAPIETQPEQPAALPVEESVVSTKQLVASTQSATIETPAYEFSTTTLQPSSGDANRVRQANNKDTVAITLTWKKQPHATLAHGDFLGDRRIDDFDAAILARHLMMTSKDGENNDDENHDEVFAKIGATDDMIFLN